MTIEGTMYSIVDPNITRKVLMNKYSIGKFDEIDEMIELSEAPKLPYVYIKPKDNLHNVKYPHNRERRLPDYKLNDKVFRNGTSGIGLGYYSIE